MREIQFLVRQETLIKYNSLILPPFDHCDQIWSNASKELLERLQRLQNRVQRIIRKSGLEIRSRDILNRSHWDDLFNRRIKHEIITVFKVINHLYPQHISDQVMVLNHSNKYQLRGCDAKVVLAQPKTYYFKRSFRFRASMNWNNLPNKVSKIRSLTHFKSLVWQA